MGTPHIFSNRLPHNSSLSLSPLSLSPVSAPRAEPGTAFHHSNSPLSLSLSLSLSLLPSLSQTTTSTKGSDERLSHATESDFEIGLSKRPFSRAQATDSHSPDHVHNSANLPITDQAEQHEALKTTASFYRSLKLATGAPRYVRNRQILEDLCVPLLAHHIRALTASFDSKLAYVGKLLVRQLGRYLR